MGRELRIEINRGLSYRMWRELEDTTRDTRKKTWAEESRFGLPDEGKAPARTSYPFLSDLRPGDSVFVSWDFCPNRVRSAALGLARSRGWHIVTKKSYEGDGLGVRIFRIS